MAAAKGGGVIEEIPTEVVVVVEEARRFSFLTCRRFLWYRRYSGDNIHGCDKEEEGEVDDEDEKEDDNDEDSEDVGETGRGDGGPGGEKDDGLLLVAFIFEDEGGE